MIISMGWNNDNAYGAQIGLDDTTKPNMYVRNKATNWSEWAKVLLSTNYTDYTVTKTGGGASGDSWAIGITGNAASSTYSTYVGDSSMTLQAHYSNEINFGGANDSSMIYFGYRALGSKPIPTTFVFGGSTGTASIRVNDVYLGSGTSSYITASSYTGNAATATALTSNAGSTSVPVYFTGGKPSVISSLGTSSQPFGTIWTSSVNITDNYYPSFNLIAKIANGGGTYSKGMFEANYSDSVGMWIHSDKTTDAKSRRALVLYGYQ
jgi:hypothetical protein